MAWPVRKYAQSRCKRGYLGGTYLRVLHRRVEKRVLPLRVKQHVYQMSTAISIVLQEDLTLGVVTLLHNFQTAVRPRDPCLPIKCLSIGRVPSSTIEHTSTRPPSAPDTDGRSLSLPCRFLMIVMLSHWRHWLMHGSLLLFCIQTETHDSKSSG